MDAAFAKGVVSLFHSAQVTLRRSHSLALSAQRPVPFSPKPLPQNEIMKLVANLCIQCGRAVGYVTPDALQIPTLCVLCAGDKEIMEEWGHSIDRKEKPIREFLISYRSALSYMDLK